MASNSVFLPIIPIGFSVTAPSRIKFMEEQNVKISHVLFTDKDVFLNYPMDEISMSLQSADITIPSHLQTADEIDEWIMSL